MTILSTAQLYAIFLESDWWRDLSKLKRSQSPRCSRCPATTKLQSHHRFYRPHWFDTQLEDLEVLCLDCHEKEHGISTVKFTPNTKAQANQWRKGNRKRSWNGGQQNQRHKKSRRQRIKEQSRRERIQGLEKSNQLKPWHKFRTKPVHNYVNRGTSSN